MRPPFFKGGEGKWESLRDTLGKLGAYVEVVNSTETSTHQARDYKYVRDTGVFIPDGDGGHFLSICKANPGMDFERSVLVKQLPGNVKQHVLAGDIEGGNMVHDPHRQTLFVGRVDYDFARDKKIKPPTLPPGSPVVYQEQTTQFDKGLEALKAYIGQQSHSSVLRRMKVVELKVRDTYAREFFHLDGCFNVLPGGQAMFCPEVLEPESVATITRLFGEKNLLPISLEEARKSAINFITVGQNIVTPHCSPETKQKLEAWGYGVTDPVAAGLAEGSWNFSDMASVRCATMKVSADQTPSRSPLL